MTDFRVLLSLADAERRRRVIDAVSRAGIELAGDGPARPDDLHVVDEDAVRRAWPCIVVLESVTRRQATELLDAGADGLVLAADLDRGLGPTMMAVAAGQIVVPRCVRDAVRRPMLSPREKQILGMVVMGFTNQEIGARLNLASSTIKSHLRTMFVELGVGSRKEAADLVLDPTAGLGTGILTIAPHDEGIRSDDAPDHGRVAEDASE